MRRLLCTSAIGLAGLSMFVAGSTTARAQEPERAPLANAFGRFWGIGWSAGYHSRAESRFGVHRYMPDHNVVPEPIRGAAASQHLGGPNTTMYPGNAPVGAYYGMPMQMMHTTSPMVSGGYFQPGPSNSLPGTSIAPSVVKPAEPPPSWLKQYMKPNASPQESDTNLLLDDSSPSESSPSDRRGSRYQPGISILQ